MTRADENLPSLIREQQAAKKRLSDDIVARYEQMTDSNRRAVALVVHRCKARGCPALVVWRSGDHLLVHLHAYRLRPQREQRTSVESARSKHTDGQGRWPARGVLLDDYAGQGDDAGLPVNCNHVNAVVSIPELFAQVNASIPGRPFTRLW